MSFVDKGYFISIPLELYCVHEKARKNGLPGFVK